MQQTKIVVNKLDIDPVVKIRANNRKVKTYSAGIFSSTSATSSGLTPLTMAMMEPFLPCASLLCTIVYSS